jgi:hypothetical protein
VGFLSPSWEKSIFLTNISSIHLLSNYVISPYNNFNSSYTVSNCSLEKGSYNEF